MKKQEKLNACTYSSLRNTNHAFPFISRSVVQFVLNLGQTRVHTDSPHLAVDICLEEGKYI